MSHTVAVMYLGKIVEVGDAPSLRRVDGRAVACHLYEDAGVAPVGVGA